MCESKQVRVYGYHMKVEISLYYQSQRITTRLEPVTPPFMYIPPARITMCGQLPLVFLPLSFFNTEAILDYNYCTLGLYTRELAFWPDRNVTMCGGVVDTN